jgi:hypothetical protein
MDESRHSSLSERGSSYLPSLSSSGTTDGSYAYPEKSITKIRMPSTFSSLPTTHHKTSLRLYQFSSTPFLTAPPPHTIHSDAPLLTSTIGMRLQKSNATDDRMINSTTSIMNLPSFKPRSILLKMILRRVGTALKLPASRPAFRIWKDGLGQKITPRVDVPLDEGPVEDQEVQTRTGGDDMVLYPRFHVICTNQA